MCVMKFSMSTALLGSSNLHYNISVPHANRQRNAVHKEMQEARRKEVWAHLDTKCIVPP